MLFLGIVFTGMPMPGMDFGSDSLEVSVCRRTRYFFM